LPDQALSLKPLFTDTLLCYTGLGEAYFRKHQYKQALTYLNKVLAVKSFYDEDVYFNIGLIYAAQKQYGLAITNLEKALRLNPKFPLAHFCLGRIYVEIGDKAQAKIHFNKAGIKFN
jgi:tetratricopeptide (TPR) repeat protein